MNKNFFDYYIIPDNKNNKDIQAGDIVLFVQLGKNSEFSPVFHAAICCGKTKEGVPCLAHATVSGSHKSVAVTRMRRVKNEAYLVFRMGDAKLRDFAARLAFDWASKGLPYDKERYGQYEKNYLNNKEMDLNVALEKSKEKFLMDGYLTPIKFAVREMFCENSPIWPGGKSFICHQFVVNVLDTARILLSCKYLFRKPHAKSGFKHEEGIWASIRHCNFGLAEHYEAPSEYEQQAYDGVVGRIVEASVGKSGKQKPALPLPFFVEPFQWDSVKKGRLLLGVDSKKLTPELLRMRLQELCNEEEGRCQQLSSIVPRNIKSSQSFAPKTRKLKRGQGYGVFIGEEKLSALNRDASQPASSNAAQQRSMMG